MSIARASGIKKHRIGANRTGGAVMSDDDACEEDRGSFAVIGGVGLASNGNSLIQPFASSSSNRRFMDMAYPQQNSNPNSEDLLYARRPKVASWHPAFVERAGLALAIS